MMDEKKQKTKKWNETKLEKKKKRDQLTTMSVKNVGLYWTMTTQRTDKKVRRKKRAKLRRRQTDYYYDFFFLWMVKCLLGVNGHSDQYITNKQTNKCFIKMRCARERIHLRGTVKERKRTVTKAIKYEPAHFDNPINFILIFVEYQRPNTKKKSFFSSFLFGWNTWACMNLKYKLQK